MDLQFDKRLVLAYSNFMKYIIPFALYNIILTIIENSTCIYTVDLMFSRDMILSELLSPLYFLSPHLYLDILNEQFPNQCDLIFNYNGTRDNEEEEEENENEIEEENSRIRNLKYNNITNFTYINNNSSNVIISLKNFSQTRNLEENEEKSIEAEVEEEEELRMYQRFSKNSHYYNIKFRGKILYTLDNSYCIYNSNLIFIAIGIILLMTLLIFILFFLNTRGHPNLGIKIASIIITNSINFIIRPLFIFISVVLVNRPIVYLYKGKYIKSEYKNKEAAYMVSSLLFLIYFVLVGYIYNSYINNTFCTESLPYDSFQSSLEVNLIIIKVFIGFKITYDKLMGINDFTVINLIVGLFIFLRGMNAFSSREKIVNHVYLKNSKALISIFCCIYITLKLMNQYVNYLQTYSGITMTLELTLIIVLIGVLIFLFSEGEEFTFRDKDEFLDESMKFIYYITRTFPTDNLISFREKKKEREDFIDSVIIGHKMKCNMEECIICCEDIYNPDLKTLCLILYQQFLLNEKEYKEKDEGLTLIIKLMYLKIIDEEKIHRLAYTILKNLKNKNLGFETTLKISYIYQKNLDELNTDLKGLLKIKYGEVNDDLLMCIKNFEEILGFIKTRTEKVELVTNKTNSLGQMYNTLLSDLHFLKKNKRTYFDTPNFLQIICIVKLLFPRPLDNELIESLDYNFIDFLEYVDREFAENISFLLKYDFNNKSWRIKKIPKKFIDMTNYKISELLDQSLEKIFPKILAKSRIKKLENEIILSNMSDTKLEFKTVICDKETNARYVKFIIDIIPHLEDNYLLYMYCHFHKRQLIIIDEYGNFINGSDVLYEKVGINAEIVAASKGRINMFTMFNLDKKQKLEDVKIVSIANEGVLEATKNLFLLENNNNLNSDKAKNTAAPSFLNSFIKNEVNGQFKKDKSVVFLHLFSKEVINDTKYYIYNIKISNPEDKKKHQKENENSNISNEEKVKSHTMTVKHLTTDYSNSSEEKEPLKQEKEDKKEEEEEEKKIKKEDKKDDDINTYQNYVNYYNTFYESQHSMSMTMNTKTNVHSYGSSQANSSNSDVFGYLLMKTVGNKSSANKFEAFIYIIFFFNIGLVLFGLCCIIYLQTYSKNSYKLLDTVDLYHNMVSKVFKSTMIFFFFFKYETDSSDTKYYDYLVNTLKMSEDSIKYDSLIKNFIEYDSSLTLNDIIQFNNYAYDYFSNDKYTKNINYYSYFVHLDPSGSYNIKKEKLKNIIDLFTLTINQIANEQTTKLFLEPKYLEYTYNDSNSLTYPNLMTLSRVDSSSLTKDDKIYFTDLINIYHHLFNYFNSYVINFQDIAQFLNKTSDKHFKSLHNTNKVLLIIFLIFNILFVSICLSSIIIYRKILKTEFQNLYGLSEDNITKLQEKFQYVKELIKSEQSPSKIYTKIRKMREEIEQANLEDKLKKKRREQKESLQKQLDNNNNINSQNKNNNNNNNNNFDDSQSNLTSNSLPNSSEYLQFSGAVKGLYRSSTLRAKQQLKKLSKEARKAKASQDLLKRLNFDFEMVKNFILFIVFMAVFYLIIGIVVIIISQTNFHKVEISISFTSNVMERFYSLFNFYSSVKLSIIFNKPSPYTLFNGDYNPFCKNCVLGFLSLYSQISNELSNIENNEKNFYSLGEIDYLLQGNSICSSLYSNYTSTLNSYLTKINSNLSSQLIEICNNIPILQSNVNNILTYIIVYTRQIYSLFLTSDKSIEVRLILLVDKFIENDIIMTMFTNFYFEYIFQNIITGLNKKISKKYYSFCLTVFVINIFIDLLMILFIWFKIYFQIIKSVANVQLVTDSVSII